MAQFIYAIIAGGAIWQSLLAIWQFAMQLGANTPGVAKVVIAGGRLVRAYGHFPHPNVLSAFLLLGLISFLYWISSISRDRGLLKRLLLAVGFFVVLLSLILTFSRAAWLTAPVAVSLQLLAFRRKIMTSDIIRLMVLLLLVLFIFFGWLIFPRLWISSNEPAFALRQTYNQIGWEIIKDHPLTGVGFGQQVEYAVNTGLYQKYGLTKEWQWQPIHNLYLLMASEVGLIGLFIFLSLVIGIFIRNWKLEIRNSPAATMLIALLLLGLFDHFLWTLPSGRLMLILVLGLNLISSRSLMDRMPPSLRVFDS